MSLENRIADILTMGQAQDLSSLLEALSMYVKSNGSKVNSSQLRNIFSKVLLAEKVLDIQLIRPKLMYVAARQTNFEAKKVVEFLELVASKVKTDVEMKNFQIFMEAFVAYHKYFNPKG
jgi:CRISPR type III-A-associated protein Csm2